MTFKDAVEKTSGLENAWRAGLKALRTRDKPHIRAEDTHSLKGSVDLDSAYMAAEPNANRWDYAIAYRHTNREEDVVYWVELHSGNDSEINVVIKKAQWLIYWLKNTGTKLNKLEKDILWVSSGSTRLSPSAPQRKRMAEVGLRQVGSTLRIPQQRKG